MASAKGAEGIPNESLSDGDFVDPRHPPFQGGDPTRCAPQRRYCRYGEEGNTAALGELFGHGAQQRQKIFRDHALQGDKNLLPGDGEKYLGDAQKKHKKGHGGQQKKKGGAGGKKEDLILPQKRRNILKEANESAQMDDGGAFFRGHFSVRAPFRGDLK